MKQERRITRDDTRAMALQIQRAVESGDKRVQFQALDQEFVLERSDTGGLAISTPGQPMASRFYVASAERPADYPASLPFIPDEPVTVSHQPPDLTQMIWWAPRDADALHTRLEKESVSQGWSVQQEHNVDATNAVRVFEKGGVTRRLHLYEGMVSLMEMKAR